MIYKVYYQEKVTEMPVRENTQTMYVEATSEREVRKKLSDRPFNIEHIQLVEGEYLEYERQKEYFEVLEIE
ncbi:DNA-directed RNA polymerase subunit epsilon [Mesobacillus maritimus]|uniref:DNA-dependent RNA polymerase subunit epsilon n=1 Tax=Mesobacillus maritimus TaxID=1643336 RepID=UPI0020415AEA|nr:RNA polymerase epsilon subunit [Mesobacillus maritimus]MCM3586263.1 DNA-directed RNA polymerase subunit epsilon [Mesobacillus maritimus]MCM3667590.1 DNA-directed RNA polymerase subunit epsilon [Mesobacillus maritimus]